MRRASGTRRGASWTVGLCANMVQAHDRYQVAVWNGALEAARSYAANLCVFSGSGLNSPYAFESQQNHVYELARKTSVDGLLITTAALSSRVSDEEFAAFCARFSPLPVVCIGEQVGEFSTVLVENESGVRAAVDHLVRVHGRRRLAFLRGFEVNAEAEARYRAFIDALAENGLAFDPRRILEGEFRRDLARGAVRGLLAARVSFDAILAANDLMALGAMDALAEAGIDVPGRVSVVGFDDVAEARACRPALTTVRQPLSELGVRAFELLLAELNGDRTKRVVSLPTQLVVRGTCGCPGGFWSAEHAEAARLTCAAELADAIAGLERVLPRPGWYADMERALRAELDGRAGELPTALYPLLRRHAELAGEVAPWHLVLSSLRRGALEQAHGDLAQLRRLEDIMQRVTALVTEVLESSHSQRCLELELGMRLIHETGCRLLTANDLDEVLQIVAGSLPELLTASLYVALFDEECPNEATLVLACEQFERVALPAGGVRFASDEVIPGALSVSEERKTWVAKTLYFREHVLGFAVFGVGARADAQLYNFMADYLGAAIYRVRSGNAARLRPLAREQQGAPIDGSRQSHASSSDPDPSSHGAADREKLLVMEKYASVGRLMTGIAHDVSSPMAAVRVALTKLDRLMKDVDVVEHEDGQEFAEQMKTALRIAERSAEQAMGVIRLLRSELRDLDTQPRRVFDVRPLIAEAVAVLRQALARSGCTVETRMPEQRTVLYGEPARFKVIVTNLVSSAIEAAMSVGGGTIEIGLETSPESLTLIVRDAGRPPSREDVAVLFDPLASPVRRSRGGVGLTIARDLLDGEFGGVLDVHPGPGAGTTVKARFPPRIPPLPEASSET